MERLITKKILYIQNDSQSRNNGLFTGNAGVCLALYLLGRINMIPHAEKEADKLLNFICDHTQELRNTDFRNGLSGIGWAICIMKKYNCIDGDIDNIFSNIDAVIYKIVTKTDSELRISLQDGLIGYLVYLVTRMEICEQNNSTNRYKFLTFALKTVINKIFDCTPILMQRLIRDSCPSALLDYPILFIYLRKARLLNLYTKKIDCIVQYWCHFFLNMAPYYETNKLALAVTLAYFNKNAKIDMVDMCSKIMLSKIDLGRFKNETDYHTHSLKEGWLYSLLILHMWEKATDMNRSELEFLGKTKADIALEGGRFLIQSLDNAETMNISFINGLSGVAFIYSLMPDIFTDIKSCDCTIKEIDYYYGKRSHLR